MILTQEQFLEQIRGRVGEDNSDEALSFMENMTDTYNDLSQKALGDGVDWKAKYEENDKAWRDKYKERFFSGAETSPASALEEQFEDVSDDSSPKTFNDLFEEREG